nr:MULTISPECIES: RnfH family protein [unclassified Lysobacter]
MELGEGATLAEAVAAAGFQDDAQIAGYAVFGVRAAADTRLRDGDRVELLRALQIDPKDARRRRAADRPIKK